MKTIKPLLITACFGLVACNGDSNGGGGSGGYTDEQVAEAVRCTNQGEGGLCESNGFGVWGTLDSTTERCNSTYCFEDSYSAPDRENVALTRWQEGELIPVYFRGSEDVRFTYAMNYVEDLIGYPLFDRKGVVDLDLSDPDNVDMTDLPTDWGFVWSQGTSIGDMSGNGYCSLGTVSVAPYHFATSSYVVSLNYELLNTSLGHRNTSRFTWINLDSVEGANSGQITCNGTAGNDVSIHELGHALGMLNHFSGFGFDGAWGANADRVLKTMYSRQNPPGQPFDALHIEL